MKMSKSILIPLYDLPEDIIHKKHYVIKGGRSVGKEEKHRQLLEYLEKKRKEQKDE